MIPFVGCEAQLALKCLFTPIFSAGDFDRNLGQTDLVFVYNEG